MRGLRTPESDNFIRFMELIQKEAEEMGKVFFLDCEDGNDRVVDGMEVCDLCGWLLPNSKADEFEKIWKNNGEDDAWIEFYGFVTWKEEEGLKIQFE